MIIPVILSGGGGSRIWPLSRKAYSKQFLALNSEKSLLQQTALRVADDNFEKPIIVCGESHRFLIEAQLSEAGIEPLQIIIEPEAKNTAAAIALASCYVSEHLDEDSNLLVLPSDHVINDKTLFTDTVNQGVKIADQGKIVTFGIVPTKPETGYGDIKRASTKVHNGFMVDEFIEKPSLAKAKKLITDKQYYWNSGIFLFNAKTFNSELKLHSPEIFNSCSQSILKANTEDLCKPEKSEFSKSADLSIDYALMEKSKEVAVMPYQGHWNDIGSFSALWEELDKDDNDNAIQGDALLLDSKSNYIFSESAVVTTSGVKNLVIVQTKDAVLVADKKQAQNVKDIVQEFKNQGREEVNFHRKVYRPWGTFEGLAQGDGYQVKTIVVNPGQQLSLQSHKFRNEHWVCVQGIVTVTRGSDVFDLKADQSTYIPVGEVHRLENFTDTPAMIIEVQTGSYLGEDDIVRYEDVYGRSGEGVELPVNMHKSHQYEADILSVIDSYINKLKKVPFLALLAPIKRTIFKYISFYLWKLKGEVGLTPHLKTERSIKYLCKKHGLKYYVETGCHYGELIKSVRRSFDHIYGIELSDELYTMNYEQFKDYADVTCIRGDSTDKLQEILDKLDAPSLIYLDAYYSGGVSARGSKETPINEEIETILKSQFKGVVIINNVRSFTGTHDYPTKSEIISKLKKHNVNYQFENDWLVLNTLS